MAKASLIISILTLLVLAVQMVWEDKINKEKEILREHTLELRNALTDSDVVEEEDIKLRDAQMPSNTRQALNSALSDRRLILLDSALDLTRDKDLSGHVGTYSYVVLSRQMERQARYRDALFLLNSALGQETAPSLEKSIVQAEIGSICLRPKTDVFDSAGGNSAFNDALSWSATKTDDNSKWASLNLLITWTEADLEAEEWDNAGKHSQQARAKLESLKNMNPSQRTDASDELSRIDQLVASHSAPPQEQSFPFPILQ
jgi:hypothetical protein